mmetsp:Transcript_121501/g.305512  ORF Transcript_121501/g.305512 Transcript_121501/m.305512 type:complete len:248 (-) Transcript_121501:106-849(-)
MPSAQELHFDVTPWSQTNLLGANCEYSHAVRDIYVVLFITTPVISHRTIHAVFANVHDGASMPCAQEFDLDFLPYNHCRAILCLFVDPPWIDCKLRLCTAARSKRTDASDDVHFPLLVTIVVIADSARLAVTADFHHGTSMPSTQEFHFCFLPDGDSRLRFLLTANLKAKSGLRNLYATSSIPTVGSAREFQLQAAHARRDVDLGLFVAILLVSHSARCSVLADIDDGAPEPIAQKVDLGVLPDCYR